MFSLNSVKLVTKIFVIILCHFVEYGNINLKNDINSSFYTKKATLTFRTL